MRKKTRRICYRDGYGDAHYATAYAGFLGVISAKNSRGVRYWAIVPSGLGTNTDRKSAESAEDWWDESFDHGECLV